MSVVMGNDNNETNKIIHLGPETMGNEKNERPDFTKNFKPVRLVPKEGPRFFFFDRVSNRIVYPETYHTYDPISIQANTIREYKEHKLTYVYHMYGDNPFCRIYSPDGTKIEINNPRTVMKYILHHKNEVTIGRRVEPKYDYAEFYDNKFKHLKNQDHLLAEKEIKDEIKK
jgi:hypothetical protein